MNHNPTDSREPNRPDPQAAQPQATPPAQPPPVPPAMAGSYPPVQAMQGAPSAGTPTPTPQTPPQAMNPLQAPPLPARPMATDPSAAGPSMANPSMTGPSAANPLVAGSSITDTSMTGPSMTGPSAAGQPAPRQNPAQAYNAMTRQPAPSGGTGRTGGGAPPPPVYGAPMAAQPAPFSPPPVTKAKRRARPLRTLLGVVAIITMLGVFAVCVTFTGLSSTFGSLLSPPGYYTTPTSNSFSVVQVVGEISNYGNDPYSTYAPSYCHADTVSHIKLLAENDDNKGILLYLNTPGGGVYESDEVYLTLEDYKEATGRPVWAYMADTCASGGYYIAAAADYIVANRNTTTGSIGVYIAMSDTSGLYDKLGIETVLLRSGANKGTGMSGVPITNEQRAVYQSIVDETYEQFIDLVAKGRGMDLETVRTLSDGRVYTGAQALGLGLVDELGNWDDTLAAFCEETGATDFWPYFNQQVGLARLVGGLSAALPVGDAEAALREAESTKTGVPMALYNP